MDESRKLFQEGKQYFVNQEYELALPILQKLVEKENGFADVHNMLGVIAHNHGQFSDAIHQFEKALHINPKYTEAMMNLAVLYNDLGQYKKSRVLFEKVKAKSKAGGKGKMDPNVRDKLANQHNMVGDMYKGIGFYQEAIEEYDKALKLAPHFYDIRLKHAICLRDSGNYAQALKELSNIVKENAKFLSARIERGVTLYATGKHKEAIEEWKKISKEYPHYEKAQMYLKLTASHE